MRRVIEDIFVNLQQSGNIKKEIKEAITKDGRMLEKGLTKVQLFIGKQAAGNIDRIVKTLEEQCKTPHLSERQLPVREAHLQVDKVKSFSDIVKQQVGHNPVDSRRQQREGVTEAVISEKSAEPAFIISCSEANSATQLSTKLRSLINPAKVKATVSRVRPMGKSRLLIECPTEDDCNKLKEAVRRTDPIHKLKVEDRRNIPTYFELKGVWKETTDEELMENLYLQNKLEDEYISFEEFKEKVQIVKTQTNRRQNLSSK